MRNEKKVVHMTTVHHPFDTRIYHKECVSLQKAGYNVTLIAPHSGDNTNNKVQILPLKKTKSRIRRMLFSTIEAYQRAKQLDAHYYHIHDPELLPIAWLLKNKKNVVIYDIHEDYKTSIMQKKYLPKPVRKLIAFTYNLAEKVLTNKLHLCLAEKYYKEKYPNGKCILNYPLLNNKLVNNKLDEKPIEKSLLYTGNVTKVRGALIHAGLPLIVPNLSVHFIGKCAGDLAKEMKAIAGKTDKELHFDGIDQFVEREDIDNKYISKRWLAGLALFPPTDHYMKKELTKFFEYMSVGLPVLCSDFPVWKKFIDKHKCGIAVDPYNEKEIKEAVEFLRTNPDKAKIMGENGKKAVIEELNWGIEEEKLVNWYDEIWRDRETE